MHLNSQSWETVSPTTKGKKKTKTQQTLFVTAGLFSDISPNCHKLELTSKQGMER